MSLHTCVHKHISLKISYWKECPSYIHVYQSIISYIIYIYITHHTSHIHTSHQPHTPAPTFVLLLLCNSHLEYSKAKVGAGSQTNIPLSVTIPSILPYRTGRGMHPHFTSIPSLHQQMHIRTVCTCTLHRTGPLTVSCSAWNGEQIAPNLWVDLRSISEQTCLLSFRPLMRQTSCFL